MLIWRPPYSLPFPTLFSKPFLLKSPLLSLLSTSGVAAATATATASNPPQSLAYTLDPNPSTRPNLAYGPSLQKGRPPSQHHPRRQFPRSEPLNDAKQQILEEEEEEEDADAEAAAAEEDAEEEGGYEFDESAFTRVFDITAIRAPSGDCASLESRLRGHLLNWPRIRNIARVPGDEVDEDLAGLLERTGIDAGVGDESSLVSLNRRLQGKAEGDGDQLSPVLYRDKLVKTFNSRGFVKFRNLAKLSRPKKKKKLRKEGVSGGGKKVKKEFAMVEVLEDQEPGEDLRGLLGEEFKGRRWRGPTRLLLLDENYADKGVDELPEAIKVAVPIL